MSNKCSCYENERKRETEREKAGHSHSIRGEAGWLVLVWRSCLEEKDVTQTDRDRSLFIAAQHSYLVRNTLVSFAKYQLGLQFVQYGTLDTMEQKVRMMIKKNGTATSPQHDW